MSEQPSHESSSPVSSPASPAETTPASSPAAQPEPTADAASESAAASAASLDQQIEQEAEQALAGQDMDQLMAEAEQASHDRAGPESAANHAGDAGSSEGGGEATESADPQTTIHHDMRRGRISAIRGEDVFVDLPGDTGKLQGVVPIAQFDRNPRIGAIMDFVVDHVDESQGLMFLSREGAISRATWEQLQKGAAVEARVINTNKGGLELEMVGGISAFMPASQIDTHHVDDLAGWVGQKVPAIVQQIDRRSKKVVLSRRQHLEQEAERKKHHLMSELEAGQLRDGKVSSLTKFGAFVDIGGVEGLVHVSDLSYSHVDKPADVVQAGQAVQVKVLSIDTEKERIKLGLKQVQPDPWASIEARYATGGQVEGQVVRTANFGAFVQLEPGVEGLLPLSEMSWRRITKAEEVVQSGDKLWMKILSIDPGKRRLSLSLKQAQGDPWTGAEHKYAAGQWVDGTVRTTTDFGAFVELEPGVDGLVHISELAPHRVKQVGDVVQAGEGRQCRVLEVDEENHKIRLSLKPEPESAGAQPESASARADHHAGQAGGKKPPQKRGKPGRGKAGRGKTDENLRGGMDVGGVGLGGLNPRDFD